MEEEKKYVYVLFATINDSGDKSTDVLGVFDNEKQAQEVARDEMQKRLDNRDNVDWSEEEEMKLKEKFSNWLYYESLGSSYYRVDMWVFRKELNVVDIDFVLM